MNPPFGSHFPLIALKEPLGSSNIKRALLSHSGPSSTDPQQVGSLGPSASLHQRSHVWLFLFGSGETKGF